MAEIYHLAEDAVVISFGEEISPDIFALVNRVCKALFEHPFTGFIEAVPAYACVTVFYDLTAVTSVKLNIGLYLSDLVAGIDDVNVEPPKGRLIEVPVCYDFSFGPDLRSLAAAKNISEHELVQLHTGREYLVYMMGFLPGFGYMGTLDPKLAAPRKNSPEHKVTEGSVAVAGLQTSVYPMDSPGGWQIIGRTPLRVFAPSADPPFLFSPGDRVRFYPVSAEAFGSMSSAAEIPPVSNEPTGINIAEVTSPGFYSIFVDEGRTGFRAYGVPVSGPADRDAYHLVNAVLGNPRNSTTIEVTMGNFTLRFNRDCVVSAGGFGDAFVGDRDIPFYEPVGIRAGEILQIKFKGIGIRSYIAVKGGFSAESIMNSSSVTPHARIGSTLKKGERIFAHSEAGPFPSRAIPTHDRCIDADTCIIRFFKGRDYGMLTPEAKKSIESSVFYLSNRSNRMGIHLDGTMLTRHDTGELISSAVTNGLVQLTHDGSMIILMQDCQTTGGYPAIIQIVRSDLSILAQLKPGSGIRFKMITFDRAREIEIEKKRKISDWYRP